MKLAENFQRAILPPGLPFPGWFTPQALQHHGRHVKTRCPGWEVARFCEATRGQWHDDTSTCKQNASSSTFCMTIWTNCDNPEELRLWIAVSKSRSWCGQSGGAMSKYFVLNVVPMHHTSNSPICIETIVLLAPQISVERHINTEDR